MVLDNADDLEMFFPEPLSDSTGSECNPTLSEYLPPSSKGSMLITTRDERVGKRLASMHTLIVVNPMSPQEAHDLLGKWQTKPLDRSDPDHSKQLLEALGYNPLAITQAAAFISDNRITLRKYLEIFHTSDSDVQDLLNSNIKDSRRDSQSHDSVIKTWKISFDLINKQKPRAAEILSLMAVLDRQGIPESLLRDDADTKVGFTTALGTLKAFSLISVGADGATYELHRLVQLATRKWLEMQDKITLWQEKALSAVANLFPIGDFENWTTCESLLPHASTVIQYGDTNGVCSSEFAALLSYLASFDFGQGRYEMACVRASAATDMQKRVLGLEHPQTLSSMDLLALTYSRMNRLDDAEKLNVQVLETRKRVLRPEHPHTLNSMNNLAGIYFKQYRWKEAEKLHMQVLETHKRVLGPEHPVTLINMNNLAILYNEQNRHSEAIALMESVVELRTKRLGADHPETKGSGKWLKKWSDT